MTYVPQFIPTNMQVLQGTLDQYQKGYDTETNRQNQVNDVYSAIPTTRTYDTVEKNKAMGVFVNNLSELDKKYNYDRSNQQYAKELTSQITNLRANPLWAHIQQKDEIDKQRQQLIAQRGSDYHENFNPNDITLDNAKKLQDWKPVDKKDVREAAALFAKERAQQVRPKTFDTKSVPGYILMTERLGDQNMEEASKYWNSTQGTSELKQMLVDKGMNPEDPVLLNEALTSAMSNSIGGAKTDPLIDYQYQVNARNNAKGIKDTEWRKRGNIGVNQPSPIKNMSEMEVINKEISGIDATVTPTPQQKLQRDALEEQLRYAKNTYYDIANSDNGKKSIQKGQLIINEGITDPLIDKQSLFKELENYFINTSPMSRSDLASDAVNSTNNVIDWLKEPINTILGKHEPEPTSTFKNKSLKNAVSDITSKLLGNNNIVDEPGRLKKIESEILSTAREWKKYYDGEGDYKSFSYKDIIQKPVNDQLKEGKTMVADVYDPPYSIGSAEYDKAVDVFVRNFDNFDVEIENKRGKLVPVEDKDKKVIYTKLLKDQSKIKVHAAMERESEPRTTLTTPEGDKIVLKMNVQKMGPDTAYELAKETGLSQFKDVFYKDIKLEEGKYSLNDPKDKTLVNLLTRRYGTTDAFSGLEIYKVGESQYIIKSDALGKLGYPDGYSTNSKADMMETLNDINDDYNVNKSKT